MVDEEEERPWEGKGMAGGGGGGVPVGLSTRS